MSNETAQKVAQALKQAFDIGVWDDGYIEYFAATTEEITAIIESALAPDATTNKTMMNIAQAIEREAARILNHGRDREARIEAFAAVIAAALKQAPLATPGAEAWSRVKPTIQGKSFAAMGQGFSGQYDDLQEAASVVEQNGNGAVYMKLSSPVYTCYRCGTTDNLWSFLDEGRIVCNDCKPK